MADASHPLVVLSWLSAPGAAALLAPLRFPSTCAGQVWQVEDLAIIGEVPCDNQVVEIDAFGPNVLQYTAQRLSGRHAVQACAGFSTKMQVRKLENTNTHRASLT